MSWWEMARRAKVSDNVMQRFLALNSIQKAHNGRALANVEAVFEAMNHTLMPVPELLAPLIQKLIDEHYARQSLPITDEEPTHGRTANA